MSKKLFDYIETLSEEEKVQHKDLINECLERARQLQVCKEKVTGYVDELTKSAFSMEQELLKMTYKLTETKEKLNDIHKKCVVTLIDTINNMDDYDWKKC